ncbi:MAG: phosphotransferase, partial [Chloroflexi bacterium]|nr:phosphotransferase [Chloroflexota bacterium]
MELRRADSEVNNFPRTVEEITPEWLTQVLRESGAIDSASVGSLTVKTIGDDQGMTADVVRIGLNYDREEPNAPRSVIAKLHRPWGSVDDSALSDVMRKTYEREVRFFKELGSDSGMAVPRLHVAEFDETPAEFILLLEDLSNLRAVDQADDCSLEDASTAINALARMHAKWWGDQKLYEYPWLIERTLAREPLVAQARFAESLDSFIEISGEHLPYGVEAIARKLGPKLPEVVDAIAKPPITLIHGDYRLANLFFDDSVGGVVAFDWQLAGRVKAAAEVGMFIMQSFAVESRRKHEHYLLSEYYSSIVDLGVTGYSYDELLDDIR